MITSVSLDHRCFDVTLELYITSEKYFLCCVIWRLKDGSTGAQIQNWGLETGDFSDPGRFTFSHFLDGTTSLFFLRGGGTGEKRKELLQQYPLAHLGRVSNFRDEDISGGGRGPWICLTNHHKLHKENTPLRIKNCLSRQIELDAQFLQTMFPLPRPHRSHAPSAPHCKPCPQGPPTPQDFRYL